MEKREKKRFFKVDKLKGKLFNVVEFRVKDISLCGINIISSLNPTVGTDYMIYLYNKGQKQDFMINVVRAEVIPFKEKFSLGSYHGAFFSIGCKFINHNEERIRFLEAAMESQEDLEPGHIEEI
jgi:hypothetical protein